MKLDFGCGPRPREGYEGVDAMDFGQKWKVDLRGPWPWEDASVETAHACHFVEHLTGPERIHFVNELYRVLVPGGTCSIIVPHWASCRAYGDLTHQWPPVSEFWFYYLSKAWRAENAPHNDGYTCDFGIGWNYTMHPDIQKKKAKTQKKAQNFYKEAIQDISALLTKPLEA